MRSTLCGFIGTSWRGILCNTKSLGFVFKGNRVQCFSTRRSRTRQLPKEGPPTIMEEESNAFYVVRKGDIIGIYNNLRDCQAQVSSSLIHIVPDGLWNRCPSLYKLLHDMMFALLRWDIVCDPSVSVYKGYNLRKETEEYLASQGLKNPLYSLKAADLKEDLFGEILPCPFQQPDGLAFPPDKSQSPSPPKRSNDAMDNLEAVGSSSIPTAEQSKKQVKLKHSLERSCILEFDGASKGNPGKAGAGVILRNPDGSLICRLRQGLGVVTNNVAEYRALILGMKYALKKGFKQIHAQGDSKLVCLQEFNSDADAQANLGVELALNSDIWKYLLASHEDTLIIDNETNRLAVVNMDWDHIKVVDLYVVMSSVSQRVDKFCQCLSIYPFEFGLKCMEIEVVSGPFALIDNVVILDSVAIASHIANTLDGTEFLESSNVFDLRFIPDSMDFKHPSQDVAKESVYHVKKYLNNFLFYVAVTGRETIVPCKLIMIKLRHRQATTGQISKVVLCNSQVKVTWEEDKPERKKLLRGKFNPDQVA
ncbi:hypothetical protein ZIOFF_045034 [Zingiber officinale]|uniref:RNase H type-1 domain-containing protein n=1 Tax=Zingiber officinale TaxID=94328 RepID=A0A8J5G069_ZINOF|nr:hypothetical protein ZIOFF_045034 [Zingiber officinale]